MQDFFYRDFSPAKERLHPPLDAFSERISGRGSHRKRPYYIGTAEGHLSALRIEGKLSGKKTPKTGFSSCFKRLFMALRTHLLD